MINKEVDSKFLSKLFKGSNLLSDANTALLYFNLPIDPVLKDKQIPQMLFPVNNEVKLPTVF